MYRIHESDLRKDCAKPNWILATASENWNCQFLSLGLVDHHHRENNDIRLIGAYSWTTSPLSLSFLPKNFYHHAFFPFFAQNLINWQLEDFSPLWFHSHYLDYRYYRYMYCNAMWLWTHIYLYVSVLEIFYVQNEHRFESIKGGREGCLFSCVSIRDFFNAKWTQVLV